MRGNIDRFKEINKDDTMEAMTISDPIVRKALDVIQLNGWRLREMLYKWSADRIRGAVPDDKLHDADEPRSAITHADIMVHTAVVEAFADELVTIIAEEGIVEKPNARYRIVLDDLDGTYNASRGVLGRSAVSLAIDEQVGGAFLPLAGMWYNPYFDEAVVGVRGCGVWYRCEGKEMPVGRIESPVTLSRSRIITGSTGATNDPRSKMWNLPLSILAGKIPAPLNYESSVVSLVDVALSRAEGFVIAGNKAWDLWSARTIFRELGIPYAFFTECWRR